MNRPLTRWLVLITFTLIVAVAVSIPVLTNYDQYQKISVPGATLTRSTTEEPAKGTLSSQISQVNTQIAIHAAITGTPSPTPQNNCTYSASYWISRSDSWPTQFVVGNYRYSKAEALKLLQTTSVDITTLLFLHFNTAYLNIINGADPTSIENAVLDASDWLENHPAEGAISVSEAQQATQLIIKLLNYNMGILGPGHCPDESSSQASQASGIMAPVLLITPESIILTSFVTPIPSDTATFTPTTVSTQPTYDLLFPTATRRPNRNVPPPTVQPPTAQPTAVPPTKRPPTAPPPTAPPPPTSEPLPTPPPP
jgi:hypothetical protein